ncbi:hypothetical protein IE53DRAFT_366292 [Violaceomyces palustris]|uniref:Uncharacterized protein n=1 Tax=Violaceomyces palustris TaxID=1673888 RepID=A0ACD0P686_9BASI|nr:hypothetical protein IE53DRAFT_366292 [Violaceomyces palustris]
METPCSSCSTTSPMSFMDSAPTLGGGSASRDSVCRDKSSEAGSHRERETTTTSTCDHQRPIKRSRVRQACNRCKSRKIKCGDLRPCVHCTTAGVECVDWRPGEDYSYCHTTTTTPAPANGAFDLFTDSSPSGGGLNDGYYQTAPSPGFSRARKASSSSTSVRNGKWEATRWPPRIDAERYKYLAYPYDSVYTNEFGHLKALSLSSGLGSLSYLHEYHKLANEQMLDALWQVLDGGGDTSGFALDSEIFSPASTGSIPISEYMPGPSRRPLSGRRDAVESRRLHHDGGPDLWTFLETRIPAAKRRTLIHNFLTTTYVLWPTFILSDFLDQLKEPSHRSEFGFVALIISMCAVSSKLDFSSPPVLSRGFDFVELYNEVKAMAPRSTDFASLSHIQALFYLSNHCFGAYGPKGVTKAHHLMNEAVSRCFDAGLHRSAETYTEAFSRSELEARRRTLWAVYCGDKVSAAYGRPATLRLSSIDVPEIDVESPEYDERLPSSVRELSLRHFYRANVRLHCVLERVVEKINLPACSASSALERLGGAKPRRPRESCPHDASTCRSDHGVVSFEQELELLEEYQSADLPPPSTTFLDDNMYHAHTERLRTMGAFVKMFIYRHLFCMANTNLTREPPRLNYREEAVRWSRELLLSQRKMLQRGMFTDFASFISYQLSQTGRCLIPVIYVSSRMHEEVEGSTRSTGNPVLMEAQTQTLANEIGSTRSRIQSQSPSSSSLVGGGGGGGGGNPGSSSHSSQHPPVLATSKAQSPLALSNSGGGIDIVRESRDLLLLCYDLLQRLSTRYSASHRSLQILQQAVRRLDMHLDRPQVLTGFLTEEGEDDGSTTTGARGAVAVGSGPAASGDIACGSKGLVRPSVMRGGGKREMDPLSPSAGGSGSGGGREGEAPADRIVGNAADEAIEAGNENGPSWISDLPLNTPQEKAAHVSNPFVNLI